MSSAEFIAFCLENWQILLFWSLLLPALLCLIFYKIAPARFYDPLLFYIAFNCGTAYAVVVSLYQTGNVSNRMFFMVAGYALLFYISIYLFMRMRHNIMPAIYKKLFLPTGSGKREFYLIVILYSFFAAIVLALSGFGALASTNRFEQARGVGIFIRVLDALRLVILSYGALLVWGGEKKGVKKWIIAGFLIFFLLFSSLLGGAKFAMLEGLYAMAVAVSALGIRIKLNLFKLAIVGVFATLFALFILQLNQKNNDGDVVIFGTDRNPVVDGLMFRILSNGDTYYQGLPNDVIDHIQTDNIVVRFLSSIIGISQVSKIVGYPVEDYSIGRATLLYHDPQNTISGGPVSHFDLFSYKFLGYFGFVFVLFITYMLSTVASAIKKAPRNYFYISVLCAMWLRALATVLEPTVGIAYVVDIVFIFFAVKIFSSFFLWSFKTS